MPQDVLVLALCHNRQHVIGYFFYLKLLSFNNSGLVSSQFFIPQGEEKYLEIFDAWEGLSILCLPHAVDGDNEVVLSGTT